MLCRLALRRLASRNTLECPPNFDNFACHSSFSRRARLPKRAVQKPSASFFMCGHLGNQRGPKTLIVSKSGGYG